MDGSAETKTTSDLEKKKLEAQLKAAEEIAKIKQSVIEKRLELELAALQGGCNLTVTQPQQPNSVNEVCESCTNETVEHVEEEQKWPTNTNYYPPPPPAAEVERFPPLPLFTLPIPVQNQYPRSVYSKPKTARNDTDFLIRNDLRNLKLGSVSQVPAEKKVPRSAAGEKPHCNINLPQRGKFMQLIEKPKFSCPMESNPFRPASKTSQNAQQTPVTETYYADRITDTEGNLQGEEAGSSVENKSNCYAPWKSWIGKVRKKWRKRAPPWP